MSLLENAMAGIDFPVFGHDSLKMEVVAEFSYSLKCAVSVFRRRKAEPRSPPEGVEARHYP